jgi:hypothetical protein
MLLNDAFTNSLHRGFTRRVIIGLKKLGVKSDRMDEVIEFLHKAFTLAREEERRLTKFRIENDIGGSTNG